MHNSDNLTWCTIPCGLCGSTEAEELCLVDRDGGYLRTVICCRCGLVYSDPRPDSEQIRDYYHCSYRIEYKGLFQPKLKHVYRSGKVALDRFSRLAPILKRGYRVLDFGAGSGEFVDVLRALGYDASGFEPNDGYARFASEALCLPITHGFYQDIQVEAESQDVVTAFHVLEHLENPYDALRRARNWLRPTGQLVVETPNVEAICQWPRNRFHRAHLYNFNLATLEMLGRKAGYRAASSSISSDGGNITVVFQKDSPSASILGEIPGNYDRICSIIRRHTFFRHLFTLYPYVRFFRKIAARFGEWRATRKLTSPKEILDGLIARQRQHWQRIAE